MKRGSLLVLLVIVFAFFIGYQHQSIADWFSSTASSESTPGDITPSNSAAVPEAAESEQPAETSPQTASTPTLVFGGAPQVTPTPGKAPTLANTLDSIRPGELGEHRIQQRNQYFEKLSQQLRELRGGEATNAPSFPFPGSTPILVPPYPTMTPGETTPGEIPQALPINTPQMPGFFPPAAKMDQNTPSTAAQDNEDETDVDEMDDEEDEDLDADTTEEVDEDEP